METGWFPSIFPIRIPMRSGHRASAGRADFGELSCSPALRRLLLAANTHTMTQRRIVVMPFIAWYDE